MARRERPLPPMPQPARLCTYGIDLSTGWRWFSGLRRWERVCDRHIEGAARRGEYVPDTAMTDREGC
ncbi:hypothetical protein ACBI99_44825 [Nonomuraea sp. ATR24]|uniref:hypothetical protein n=1 Tax=Nonomuraea sp. ATR24 TaxID=1676744 RepID=UPI0035BEFB1C